MEAVRLETGFVYIKVVVVTAAESCGKEVKVQVRALNYLRSAVGKTARTVGKDVWNLHYHQPLILSSIYQPCLPT